MSHEAVPPDLTEADPPADNVVSLYGWPVTRPNEPIDEVVWTLRYMLARAEKGELTSVAVIGVDPARSITWAYSKASCKLHELVGAAAVMQARMLDELLNAAEDLDRTDQIPPAS
jgi:hypothetical protein